MGVTAAAVSALSAGLGVALVVAALTAHRGRSTGETRRALRLPDHLALRAALAGLFGILTLALTRWPVAAAWMAVAGMAAPSLAGVGARRAAQVAKVEAVATWAEMLRDQVAVGADLAQAVRGSAAVAPAPIAEEVSRLELRLRHQQPAAALAAFAEELADPMGDLVVAALMLAFTRPARRLAELLGQLAQATREQAGMRLRIERDRARVRTVARAAAAAAMGWVVLVLAVAGGFFAPYDSAAGQAVLALVGLCFAAAFVGLARMDRVAQPTRLGLAAEERA